MERTEAASGVSVRRPGAAGRTATDPTGQPASAAEWIRAMNATLRGPSIPMVEREDECLRRWEDEFLPAGMRQAEAAEVMGRNHPVSAPT